MFHPVAEYLKRAGWENWSAEQFRTRSGLTWWIFDGKRTFPAVVAKLFEDASAAERGRREAAVLEELGAAAGELSIPGLLLACELRTGFLMAQSGVPGLPWDDLADPGKSSTWRGQLAAAANWLGLFQAQLGPHGTAGDGLADIVNACRLELPDLTGEEETLLSLGEEVVPVLQEAPGLAVHGDFWAGNILDSGGRLSVIDWSTFHYGAATEDLYNFVAALGYRRGRTAEEGAATMWRVFFGDSPLARATETLAREELRRQQMAEELLQPAFTVFLIHRLGRTEFRNHAAWRAFAARYVRAGMPRPFDRRAAGAGV